MKVLHEPVAPRQCRYVKAGNAGSIAATGTTLYMVPLLVAPMLAQQFYECYSGHLALLNRRYWGDHLYTLPPAVSIFRNAFTLGEV